MNRWIALRRVFVVLAAVALAASPVRAQDDRVHVAGELKQWHDVVLTLDGPHTGEAADPNPFLDYRLTVTFANGSKRYEVPGYFAADGNAAESGATDGNRWRVHFVPDETGEWSYAVSFRTGPEVAVSLDPGAGRPVAPDGASGRLVIGPSDKTGQDYRRRGMRRYVGSTTPASGGRVNTSSRRVRRAPRICSPTTSSTARRTTVAPGTGCGTACTASSRTCGTGDPAILPGGTGRGRGSSARSTTSRARG